MTNTVLVVDDSPTATHLICSTLVSAGYSTLNVGSAEEAMEVAKAEKPDAILMDVVLSGENGFQATRRLNKDPETKNIPVIIVSSKNKASDKVWGLRQGAAGYITKPFSSDELLAKLKELIKS